MLAAAADLTVSAAAERRLGSVAETWREGRAGTLLRAARALTAAGAVAALTAPLLRRGARPAAAVGGLAMLAGSACTRFGIFAAGVASAEDPRHTVVPQRERLERAAREADHEQ